MTRKPERTLPLAACLLGIAALFGAGVPAQQSAPDAEPATGSAHRGVAAAVAAVQRLQDALVEGSGNPDVHERFAALRGEITATHDLAYIGELMIRRQWRDFSEQQRSEFLSSFVNLSVMSYAARFVDVAADSFEMHGAEEIGNGRIQVRSSIARADGGAVPLDYVLQDGPEGWRIVNVIADGVSDIALKRAEYRALLEESGFDGLVAELQKQTENLAESAAP